MPNSLPHRSLWAVMATALLLAACASSGPVPESAALKEKTTWYWLGSTSYLDHYQPQDPSRYWLAIDGEKATLQTDCNKASAKVATTKEGHLWITNIATTRVACPQATLESQFIRQIGLVDFADQRGEIARVPLQQLGQAMYFARYTTVGYTSYRCDSPEPLVVATLADSAYVWLGDEFFLLRRDPAKTDRFSNASVVLSTLEGVTSLWQDDKALVNACRPVGVK